MDIYYSWENQIKTGRELKTLGLTFIKIVVPENKMVFKYAQNDNDMFYFFPIDILPKIIECDYEYYHEVSFSDDEEIIVNKKYNYSFAKNIIRSEKLKIVDLPREICIKLVLIDGCMIHYFRDEIKFDMEICKIAASRHAEAIENMDPTIIHNEEFYTFILSKNGRAIIYFDEYAQNNFEICKVAAANNGESLRFMSDEIKNNFDICKITVANNGETLRYMSDEIKNNFEICKLAVASNGKSLRYMCDEFKNNFEICKLAATSNGESLRFMSDEIKNNFEICKLAATSNGESLRYMSDEFKNNFEICKLAAASNGKSIRYMSDEIKKNFDNNPILQTTINTQVNDPVTQRTIDFRSIRSVKKEYILNYVRNFNMLRIICDRDGLPCAK
jgi:hypothetical protein